MHEALSHQVNGAVTRRSPHLHRCVSPLLSNTLDRRTLLTSRVQMLDQLANRSVIKTTNWFDDIQDGLSQKRMKGFPLCTQLTRVR
jgi:hypothetical protein